MGAMTDGERLRQRDGAEKQRNRKERCHIGYYKVSIE
jgi:hypothetical protein